jgi:hypothetical protein
VVRDFASDRPAAARAPTDGKVLRAKIVGMGVLLVVAPPRGGRSRSAFWISESLLLLLLIV